MVKSMDIANHIHYSNARFFGMSNAAAPPKNQQQHYQTIPQNTPSVYISVSVSEMAKKNAQYSAMANRKKIKPMYASSAATASKLKEKNNIDRYIIQAELAIDTFLTKNCTACNPSIKSLSVSTDSSMETTTTMGDQPLIKESCRMVPINEGEVVVVQPGTYYRGVDFIPSERGKKVSWYSCSNNGIRQQSARLCCVLNAINSFKSDSSGIIRDFQMLTFPEPNTEFGPLGSKCIHQSEIDSSETFLIFILFVQ